MIRHQHPTNNRAIGAPPGVSYEECVALPITDALYPDGSRSLFSFWMPTSQELALLAAGAPVRLEIRGAIHPMVSVGVDGDGVVTWSAVPASLLK